MKKIAVTLLLGFSILLVACGGKAETETNTTGGLVEEVSKALETAQSSKGAVISEDQEITKKLFEIGNWLTLNVWNEGFCDISSYIGRGKNAVGGELDLDYTLHKLDNTMKKGEEYNDFITGLDDTDRYKELKYIWTEKLYPEMNNLYDNIKEKKPEPNDPSSTYDASKFSTYSSDFNDECSKVKDEIAKDTAQQGLIDHEAPGEIQVLLLY